MINVIKTQFEDSQEFYSKGSGRIIVTYKSADAPYDDRAAAKEACKQLSESDPHGPTIRVDDFSREQKTTYKDGCYVTSFMAELCSKAK